MLSKAMDRVLNRLAPLKPIKVLVRASTDPVRHVSVAHAIEMRWPRLTKEQAQTLIKGLDAHIKFAKFESRKEDRKHPPFYQGRGVYYKESPNGNFLRLEIRRYADGTDTLFLDANRDLVFPPKERKKADIVKGKKRRITDQVPENRA